MIINSFSILKTEDKNNFLQEYLKARFQLHIQVIFMIFCSNENNNVNIELVVQVIL